MRYYLIAGEQSGDLYGSMLIDSILKQDPKASFRFVGGKKMKESYNGLFRDFQAISVMGYWEVITNLNRLNKFLEDTKNDIVSFNPDKIIYIDFPGFNLRLAKWAKQKNYFNTYFICPKIWAWKKSRHKQIKAYIDQLICILPFEDKFLKSLNISSSYFGHPLTELLGEYNYEPDAKKSKIALLPGSRKQELKYHLPILDKLIKARPKDLFYLSKMEHIDLSFYKKHLDISQSNLKVFEGKVYDLLTESSSAIIASGTASLEAALIGIPHMVIYKTDRLSYGIAKALVKLNYISLPNLIADKAIVKELIQNECNLNNILDELKKLEESSQRARIAMDFQSINKQLNGENIIDDISKHIISQN